MEFDKNNPHLAIITTVFNDYALLYKLLDSLLKQKETFFTHYIYDDGSNNIDSKMVSNYMNIAKHKVVFIRGNKNLGCQKAHEYMFRYIKEPYFSWVDSDDFVHPLFTKIINKNISRHPDIDVFHLNSIVYFDDEYKTRKKHSTGFYYSKKELKRKDQIINYCFNSESKFYHEFVVKKPFLLIVNPKMTIFTYQGFQTNWYDMQLMFQLSLAGAKFRYISKPVSNIYLRPVSVSRGTNSMEHKNVIPLIIEYLNYPESRLTLFYTISNYDDMSKKIISLLRNKETKEAKKTYNLYISLLKKDGLNKDYVINRVSINHLFLKNKLSMLIYPIIRLFR